MNVDSISYGGNAIGTIDGKKEILGVNKSKWDIYEYNYDLTVMEERYNVLTFTSGNAGLMYAR